jgi:tetratricopeptide (TPR) repeat protein
MGTVWMAEQLEPIRRPVALKLIKPGMDSAQVIARFEAERQALALMDHPNIARVAEADVRHALGLIWRNLKNFPAAEKQFRRTLELRRTHLGENAPPTPSSERCLGATLEESGRAADAIPVLEDALRRLREVLGSENNETLLCLDNLGAAYARAGRLSEALALRTEALERGQKGEGSDGPDMLRRRGRLGVTYTKLYRPADAEPLLLEGYEGLRKEAGQVPPADRSRLLADALGRLVQLYDAWGKKDQADAWRKKLDESKP